MKKVLFLLSILIAGCSVKTELKDYPVSAVGIKNVVISDSFWLPKIKTIQDVTIRYAFDKCEKEGRMENFLIAGGKKQGKTRGKMPFDDTDLYKIIEGASYSLISEPNPELDAYLDSVIAIIQTGQEADGYITTWFTIDRTNPPANWVKPSKNRWENEISSHELYNSGHLFEAAAAHYWATGKRNLLDIALKNADLLVANFGPGKLQSPPGHEIVETGLIRLYHITHNAKYLELSKFLMDVRGDSTTHKLYGAYNQDHIPVIQQTEAVGHAVRAEYLYAGMTDIAAIYGDTGYLKAVNALWENIVNYKMYVTGGIGARHEGEAFGHNYELPNLTAYNETCAAIGSVYWNQRMFLLTGDSKYYDIIERTLYNALITGISLSGDQFFYPNPLESDGKYAFNMGACTRQSWFDCSCCPTNLIRFIPSIPGLIYATTKDILFVNLYMSNKAVAVVNNNEVEIVQKTGYPGNGNISVIINPKQAAQFTVKLRIPGWARNIVAPGNLYSYRNKADANIQLIINGKNQKVEIKNGYVEIAREWKKGDQIGLVLPMSIREVVADKNVKENINKVAFEYGPLVYCAEEADNPQIDNIKIPSNAQWRVDMGGILSEKVNLIKTKVSGKELTLIPYYSWSNRGIGKMKVWFPAEEGE